MSGHANILVADDEESLRLILSTVLTKAGYLVDVVGNGLEAVQRVRESTYNVVLLDIRMPQIDGLQAFQEIHEHSPDLPVILMTAYGSAEIAVTAMKQGAFDYLTKPFNVEEVKIIVARAIRMLELVRKVDYLTQEVKNLSKDDNSIGQLIGESPKIQEVYKSIGRVAISRATVLLTGESGTGKGLVAKTIHSSSNRWEKPFIQVNCGAIPEGLLESELFGHEKGAFTGAISQRPGKFELAEGGTIFLDEIAELSLSLQVKLLRVLQEREFERVGGSKTFTADVRVIAASNRDLQQEIAARRFRSDLYYRLNVFSIQMPSLRERGDDITILAEYLLKRFAADLGRSGVRYSLDVHDIFRRYPWPGNVRELENAVEHALIMSNTKVILPEHLPLELLEYDQVHQVAVYQQGAVRPLREALAEAERICIAEALARTNGNRVHAAKLLQISRRALIYKIQEHHLDEI